MRQRPDQQDYRDQQGGEELFEHQVRKHLDLIALRPRHRLRSVLASGLRDFDRLTHAHSRTLNLCTRP